MTSIDDLARRLEQIDSNFDQNTRLEGWSFDKTENNSFGVSTSPDYTVFIPFGAKWPSATEVPGTSKDSYTTIFPNALQDAFKQVLKAGQDPEKKICFIDLASLNPESGFFTEGGDGSVVNALISAIDEITDPNVTPVIRIICGDWSESAPDTWEKNNTGWRNTFEAIFWDNGKSRLKNNKNAILYCGYYRPILSATKNGQTYAPTEQWLKDRLNDASKLVKQLGFLVDGLPLLPGGLEDIMKNVNLESYLPAILNSRYLKQQTSWNHGKVLAVNGRTMMTGGGNFWDLYKGTAHSIIDHQAKLTGEAAISAHRWADYFWRYLNNIPASDAQSFQRSAKLSDSPAWTVGQAPLAPSFANTVHFGNKKVLTTSRIGDWHGSMTEVEYPLGVVDGLRDILLNVVYLKYGTQAPAIRGIIIILTYAIMTEDGEALRHLIEAIENFKSFKGILTDPVGSIADWVGSSTRPNADPAVPGSFNPYKSLGVNPNAWASRFARVCAIANAKESVVICQQRFACPPYGGDTLTSLVNTEIGLQAPNKWDGYLWPFDLLIAFGYALARTRGSKSGAAKITIVLATHKANGELWDWEDRSSIGNLKRMLKIIMRGMASFDSLIPSYFSNVAAAADVFTHVDPVPEDLIDKVVDEQFQVRRALGNNTWYYNHCKVVCVDDRLMYVGSDNAYPSYNEEHGTWIEDAAEVASWKAKFWNEMWARAVVPTDEE